MRLDPALAGEYVTAQIHTPDLTLTVLTVDGEIVPALQVLDAVQHVEVGAFSHVCPNQVGTATALVCRFRPRGARCL